MTPYGPEGKPGMIPPVVDEGSLPVVGVGAPGVVVAGVNVGVGASVVGVEGRGVEEGRVI